MAQRPITTYLNDHLAGAAGAIELLNYLAKTQAATPAAHFAAELRSDIVADRKQLEELIAQLQVRVHRSRQALAWLAEKMAEFKLRLDDPTHSALCLLEVFESLSLGIEGKRLLWRALASAAETQPELRGPDYQRLQQSATEQRERVEAMRLAAAREALGTVVSIPA